MLYVCNVDEASAATGNAHSARVAERAAKEGAGCVVISAKIEAELAELDADGAQGVSRRAWADGARAEPARSAKAISCSGLITYFTAGPKEARAWTVVEGTRAPQAAGVIHTDFEKGFIRAETIAYDDYVALSARPERATPASSASKARTTW